VRRDLIGTCGLSGCFDRVFGAFRRSINQPRRRSATSQVVAVLTIEAKNRLRHHGATAKQYCPSSSTAARHSTPAQDAGGGGSSFLRDRSLSDDLSASQVLNGGGHYQQIDS
jgi:hypothetical protein